MPSSRLESFYYDITKGELYATLLLPNFQVVDILKGFSSLHTLAPAVGPGNIYESSQLREQ